MLFFPFFKTAALAGEYFIADFFTQEFPQQVLIVFLGAFFGFLFTMLLTKFFNERAKKKKRAAVIVILKQELQNTLKSLQSADQDSEYFRYQYVAWETIVMSGSIIDNLHEAEIQSLRDIYTLIIFADRSEQQHFSLIKASYFSNTPNQKLSELQCGFSVERKEGREKIINAINQYFDDFGK